MRFVSWLLLESKGIAEAVDPSGCEEERWWLLGPSKHRNGRRFGLYRRWSDPKGYRFY